MAAAALDLQLAAAEIAQPPPVEAQFLNLPGTGPEPAGSVRTVLEGCLGDRFRGLPPGRTRIPETARREPACRADGSGWP